MSWGMVAVAGASLVGGALSSNASRRAANTQQQAADRASQMQWDMYEQGREDQAPWRTGGEAGLNQLMHLLGIRPMSASMQQTQGNFDEAAYLAANPDVAEFIRNNPGQMTAWSHYNDSGRAEGRQFAATPGAQQQQAALGEDSFGSLGRSFTRQDLDDDEGYQFRLQEGQKALDRAASAGGRFFSGRSLKDTARFSQGLASQEYGDAFNRFQTERNNRLSPLFQLAGLGGTSAMQAGNQAASTGNALASNIIGAGNAAAAGQVGSANAWQNAGQQGIGLWQQNQLMQMLNPNQATTQPWRNNGSLYSSAYGASGYGDG